MPRTFKISIRASELLVHGITATAQARGNSAVIGADRLTLLLFVAAPLLLLLPLLIPSSHATDERPARRPDRGAFAGVSPDRAGNDADCRAAGRAAQEPALLSFLWWRGRSHLRVRRIDACLLYCPDMSVVAVPAMLVRALILSRVNVHLLCYRWLADQSPKERGRHQPGRSS